MGWPWRGGCLRDSMKLVSRCFELVSWCFEPSQPPKIISGLGSRKESFRKKKVVLNEKWSLISVVFHQGPDCTVFRLPADYREHISKTDVSLCLKEKKKEKKRGGGAELLKVSSFDAWGRPACVLRVVGFIGVNLSFLDLFVISIV